MPRRRRGLAALIVLLAVLTPTGVHGQTADETSAEPTPTALLSQDGWWNRAQGRQEAEPENPLRPVIGGTIPAPSTVPPDALGVGAVLGEPDKVAAVGFLLEAPFDALVDRIVLTMKESTAANANANAAGAAITACPITDFWAGVKNGEFVNRPACEETQTVAGTRAEDGTWTFDLTSFGTSWLDGTLTQNGVLLREAVEAPASFQVSFADLASGGITVDFAATGGGFSASSDFTFEETFTTDDSSAVADDTSSFGDTTTFDDSASSSFGSGTALPSSSTGTRTAPTAPADGPADAGAGVTPVVATPAAATTDLFGNLPIAAVLLLLLLGAGAALFLGLVLGPMATPTAAPVRTGGVSRALAARSAASTRR